MKDFRPYLKAKGWTIRFVWRKVGGVEAHFHRVISGKAKMMPDMADKIALATDGFLPAGFLLGVEPFTPPAHPQPPADSLDPAV